MTFDVCALRQVKSAMTIVTGGPSFRRTHRKLKERKPNRINAAGHLVVDVEQKKLKIDVV